MFSSLAVVGNLKSIVVPLPHQLLALKDEVKCRSHNILQTGGSVPPLLNSHSKSRQADSRHVARSWLTIQHDIKGSSSLETLRFFHQSCWLVRRKRVVLCSSPCVMRLYFIFIHIYILQFDLTKQFDRQQRFLTSDVSRLGMTGAFTEHIQTSRA